VNPLNKSNLKGFARQRKIFCKNFFKTSYGNCKFEFCSGSQNCVFDKVGISFKPVFQRKKKLESLAIFLIIARIKSHLFKPAFIVCKKAIMLEHVELNYFVFQMAW